MRDSSVNGFPVCGVALGAGGALMTIAGSTELHQPILSRGLVGVLGGAFFIVWGAWLASPPTLRERLVPAVRETLSRPRPGGQAAPRRIAPTRRAASETAASRAAVVSSTVSVRSGARNRSV
jgi:hypothetical protein